MSASAYDIFKQLFLDGSPFGKKTATDADLEGGYRDKASISDLLPWLGIVGDDNAVLLEDGYSVAGVIEIKPISTEARSLDYMISQRDAIQRVLTQSFPGTDRSPWICQVFAFPDKAEFKHLPDRVRDYAHSRQAKQVGDVHPYTDWFVDNVFRPHVEDMRAPEGLFIDSSSGNELPWGGNYRRVYMVVYRRLSRGIKLRRNMNPLQELNTTLKKLSMNLQVAGIKSTRLKGETIRNWLFRWFRPAPQQTGGDTEALLESNQYVSSGDVGEDELATPFDYSLADDVVSPDARSDKKTGNWYFDGLPHTVLQVERLSHRPEIGVLSAERQVSDSTICVLDQLPSSSIVIITFVMPTRSAIKKHLDIMEKRSKAQTEEAAAARRAIEHGREQLQSGNLILPVSIAIALRADDDIELEHQMDEVTSWLGNNSLELIAGDDDVYRLDSYLRFIPMGYDHRLDHIKRRNRFMYAQHLANILPFYGRETGTGNPCLLFSNRGGEPFMVDPLNLNDRARNAHLFLYGPTGAGKSASLVYLQMIIMAIYRPRFVVMEAGNSFGLLAELFKQQGLSTVDITLSPGVAPSLAPFQAALELVDANGNIIKAEDVIAVDADLEEDADDIEEEPAEKVERDLLGELLIIAQIMVTGCIESEERKFSRQDGALLKEAILSAAVECRKSGREYLLTEDVIRALDATKENRQEKRGRIEEMVDSMKLFTDGFAGELFNRKGDELPDADYIRIDLGILASGNDTKDKLSVAYISIMNQIIARAKRTKDDGRDTIALTDEAHVITTERLLAKYLVTLAKLLGRRAGVWLWMATQNMEDFPDEAEKILSMFEWWLVLFVNAKELKEIEKFKTFTSDERDMLLNTKKVQKKYTEGVVLGDTMKGLFRNVPPAPCLLLAGTEKEEKRERRLVMDEFGCTEVEAAFKLADKLREARRKSVLEHR
jgi:conjugative transfer ATPase